jgi:hypothetical protein
MKTKLTMIALALSFASISSVLAQQVSTDEVKEYQKSVETQMSVGTLMNEQLDNYLSQLGVTEGMPSKSGKIYYYESETVAVGPESPEFTKSVQIAFDKAFNKARAKFVFDRYGREVTNTISEVFEDGSSNEKVIALAESELDKALEENGVDPEEFQATPEMHRKTLFLDKTLERISRRASGDITGILPVKTFFVQNEKGTARVGVVTVYSPALVAMSNDIKAGRTPTLQAKVTGKSIAEYVNLPSEQLLTNFGPRLIFNENGTPIILSYAQWGISYGGNDDRQRERSRDLAFSRADMQASQLITEFINGKLSQETEQVAGQIINRFIETDCKDTSEKEIANLIDELSSKMKINASAKVSGSTVVKRWSHKNEFGQEIIGVVRAYSPDLKVKISDDEKLKHLNKVKQSSNDVDPENSW